MGKVTEIVEVIIVPPSNTILNKLSDLLSSYIPTNIPTHLLNNIKASSLKSKLTLRNLKVKIIWRKIEVRIKNKGRYK